MWGITGREKHSQKECEQLEEKKKTSGQCFSAVKFQNKNSSSINSRNKGLVMMGILVFIYYLLLDVEFWLVCTLEEKLSTNVVC